MEKEISYLKDKIAYLEDILKEVQRVARFNSYGFAQKKVAKEIELLKNILGFIEKEN